MLRLALVLLTSLSFTVYAEHTQTKRIRRLDSGISNNFDFKPHLKATSMGDKTEILCTISNAKPNVDMYVLCPALMTTHSVEQHCYQSCIPTNSCPVNDRRKTTHCVPHNQSVYCKHNAFKNGTVTVQLIIDRSDQRLNGPWLCTYAGQESPKFEIVRDQGKLPAGRGSNNQANRNVISGSKQERSDSQLDINNRKLAYIWNPTVVLCVLVIMALSIIVNLAFCIRCAIMRYYIDAINEGSSKKECLTTCLCLPKGSNRPPSVCLPPIIPPSTNLMNRLQHPMKNGSFQGSVGLVYPNHVTSKTPLLLHAQSASEHQLASYYPNGSIPAMLQQSTESRMLAASQSVDHFVTNPMGFSIPVEQSSTTVPLGYSYQFINDPNRSMSHTPAYYRVPSVNGPSPNLSRRFVVGTNSNSTHDIFQSGTNGIVVTDNVGGPQYFMRVQPTISGNHLVYDDVTAGGSSLVETNQLSPPFSVSLDGTHAMNHFHATHEPRSGPNIGVNLDSTNNDVVPEQNIAETFVGGSVKNNEISTFNESLIHLQHT